MTLDEIQAELQLLLSQMDEVPGDERELAFKLHEKLNELRALGLPVPADLVRLEDCLQRELAGRRL